MVVYGGRLRRKVSTVGGTPLVDRLTELEMLGYEDWDSSMILLYM